MSQSTEDFKIEINDTQSDRLTLRHTEDGSVTLFSERWQESFHSIHDAKPKQEAESKFAIPSGAISRSQAQANIHILDVCYGLGYNSAAAMEASIGYKVAEIEIIALESNLDVPQKAIAPNPTTSNRCEYWLKHCLIIA